MTRPPIAVTGMGIVTALGWTPATTWEGLVAQRSGLGPLTLFDSPRFGHMPVAEVGPMPPNLPGPRRSRSINLALHAAAEACRDAGLDNLDASQRAGIAVVLGACTGGMVETEAFISDLLLDGRPGPGSRLRDHTPATTTETVARTLGLSGPRTTVSTACSSSAMAICVAAEMLCRGEVRAALAGGVDTLTRLTLNGFASLLIMADDGCRPFDADRRGMTLGEGAAVLVLERSDDAVARGWPIHGQLLGWGASCDATHVTASDSDGVGIEQAIRTALYCAGLEPADVDYLNAHGTGTRENDSTEAKVISRVFGAKPPLVSSTKRCFGHTLGAAGAVEAVTCLLSLRHQIAPANVGLNQLADDIAFTPVARPQPAALDVAMSSSLGFGGNNSVLVFGKPPQAGRRPAPVRQARRPRAMNVHGVAVIVPEQQVIEAAAPAGIPGGPLLLSHVNADVLKAQLSPADRRRLGLAQKMAVVASKYALAEADRHGIVVEPTTAAVAVGTGFGSAGDTVDFLHNMVRRREQAPKPAKFANSVHNAIAAQLAIQFGLRGENHTFSHDETSFESAMLHASRVLDAGTSSTVLACGVDELIDFVAAMERHRQSGSAAKQQEPAGEGAASFVLTAGSSRKERVARIEHMLFEPSPPHDAVMQLLGEADVAPSDVDLVLLHAGRQDHADAMHAALPNAGHAVLRPCGRFCTVTAIGMAAAVQTMRDQRPSNLVEWRGPGPAPAGIRRLLYCRFSGMQVRFACLVSP